ncbi:MAG: SIS domain-containing protein [Gemmatimonadetes bacterium]|nr:SIS domain-containing protein [Gemmatimonadota bacterium]
MSYTQQYLAAAAQAIEQLDRNAIEAIVQLIVETRQRGGRLFVLGVGGSAGNASHAVNDFRKIAGIESYAPTDNVSELTARINDEGWDTAFAKWLEGSRLNEKDLILVLSVGGGNRPLNTSVNLVVALEYAKEIGAKICGIVGRDGGFTAQVADACAIVPTIAADVVTPLTESFQAVIWHLIVSHPEVQVERTRW